MSDISNWTELSQSPFGVQKYTLCSPELSISVSDQHPQFPGQWVMCSVDVGVAVRPMPKVKTLQDAKEEAVRLVNEHLLKSFEGLKKLSLASKFDTEGANRYVAEVGYN
jgi:hypothetical protein